MGRVSDRSDQSDPTDPSDGLEPYAKWLNATDPATVANTIICLIHQANYLLDRQISALERQFVEGGGYSERLAAERIAQRSHKPATDTPKCRGCGKPMTLRTAKKGKLAGTQFWGCSGYPDCKETMKL